MLETLKLKNPPRLFNDFVKNNGLTNEQISVVRKISTFLKSLIEKNEFLLPQVKIDKATDDEVVIYRTSENGIYDIVIDTDGDIMVSFSGYKERGWRKFYDKEEFEPSTHIQDFFLN
jgi:hypothetical protein